MSQPPAGGYPPPDPSQPGSYPPPAQPGPPPYTPPGGSYPPPGEQGGYPQQPPPGYQPPQPGYAPPPAGYQPPPAGSYPPPTGGYPPPAPGYQPGAPAFPPAGGGSAGFDVTKLGTVSRGILGASLLTFIGSFFSFWSVSYSGFSSVGYSGWSLWWWIPVVLAIAVGVAYALTLFGQLKPAQVKPEHLFYGAAASFVLMIFVLIHTLVYDGPYGILSGDNDFSSGPGFGVIFVLISTLVLTYFTAVAATNAGAKLPFKVPGPALK